MTSFRVYKNTSHDEKFLRSALFAIFWPLQAANLLQKHFYPVEKVLSFDLVGHMWKSVKIWLQECILNIYNWKWGRSRWIAYFENYLQKELGDRYGECPIAFPTTISYNNFLQHFLQDFRTTISRKIFPQDFPLTISYKNFPQDFPELDPDWLAPHHPMPYAKFPPITAFLKLAFSPPPFPTSISQKIHNNSPQQFPRNNFPQEFLARFFHKIFPQEFPKLDPDCLAPHHPIPNAKFPLITALLNRPTYHKRSKVSPPPFPQILWEPKIND